MPPFISPESVKELNEVMCVTNDNWTPTQVLAQISYESCPTERIASLSCGTAQSGSSKGKSSMSFWKEPIQSNNQRCDSQNRIVVPNGGYRYPKAKRK